MKAKFRLRENRSEKPVPIKYMIHWEGLRLFYKTGQRIIPAHWDNEQEKVKDKLKGLDQKTKESYSAINRVLYRIAEALKDIETFRKDKDIILTKVLLKKLLDEKLNRKEPTTPMDLIQLTEKVIEDSESKVRQIVNTGGERVPVRPITIRLYKTTLAHLKEFHK